MPPRLGSTWRDRLSAAQSGSTSTAFALATEAPQEAQQTSSGRVTTLESELSPSSAAQQPGTQSSATSTNKQCGLGVPTPAGAVAEQIDQLEDEVIHFMNLSLEEKEKSKVLSGQLASVTQEKEDLERQVNELDHELGQIEWQGKDAEASATDAGSTISRVNAKITKLRTTTQKLEGDLNTITRTNGEHSKTISELEEQLYIAREKLAQKTREEERLRKELHQARLDIESDKKTNEETRGHMKSTEHECSVLRTSNAGANKKLAEAAQMIAALRDSVKQKSSEVEGVRAGLAAQASSSGQEIGRKQKEIEELNDMKHSLELRCRMAEIALQEKQQGSKRTSESSEAVGAARSQQDKEREAKRVKLNSIAKHEGLKAVYSQVIKEKDEVIEKLFLERQGLFKELQQNQSRRVRAVAVAVDLSGSAAGSLTEGIKKMYSHLLANLRRSRCKTYVMTVIHGPGDAAVVKSNFSDTWDTHERVLVGQNADGTEQHVSSLRKIKEVAGSTGLALDLQAVLIGDNNTQPSSHDGCKEVCDDFSSSKPTVHVHSVVVKTGSSSQQDEDVPTPNNWQPWNYADATGGNSVLWSQKGPLPDLSDLVY